MSAATASRSTQEKKQPERTFRLGLISATVWRNEVETEAGIADIRNVKLQRSYREENGEWKSTGSMGVHDLPQAIRVLQLAQHHIEPLEASVNS